MEVKKLGLFDIISNLSMGERSPHLLSDVPADESELPLDTNIKAYSSFMVNRGFSQHPDTIFYANEMNKYSTAPIRAQYDFYRYSLRPRKRYGKWAKSPKAQKDIELISKHYNYSREKAEAIIDLFTPDELTTLRKKYHDIK